MMDEKGRRVVMEATNNLWCEGDEANSNLEERTKEEGDHSYASTCEGGLDVHDRPAKQHVLAKRETKAVGQTRLFVFLFLILCMIGVGLFVYFTTKQSESAQFEQQFHEDANKVLQSLGMSLDFTLGGIDALVVSFVSFAKATNQTWPCTSITNTHLCR
jgi:hypothetical protein